MNYLAHILLSDQTPAGRVGNLVADFIKGNHFQHLPHRIQQGIWEHRRVDSFTDRHPLVMKSISRISEHWHWFAGILIDMYYDHLLARAFEKYSPVSLRDYADEVYSQIADHARLFDDETQLALRKLIHYDRLFSYSTVSGLTDALERLSQRIQIRMPKRSVKLHEAIPDLLGVHPELENDFELFFPELQQFAQTLHQSAENFEPVSIVAPNALRCVVEVH